MRACRLFAVDDEIAVGVGWVTGTGCVGFKGAVGDGEMVGVDVLFAFEVECGHMVTPRK